MTVWAGIGWFVAVVLPLLAALGLVWLVLRRRVDDRQMLEEGTEVPEFSIENYSGMGDLLSEDALAYLQSRRGFRPAMAARWRRDRCRLFRAYLAELKLDFRRLHARARRFVTHSDEASSALVGVLMRQEMVFLWAVARVEFRLVLYRAGIGNVSLAPLVELIETMRLDLAEHTA